MRCRTRATDATRGWIPSTDRRHALHRADEGLRALHAAAPVMAMWDDHDITNNAWTDGGENHQPETDGDYVARRRAGIRAFHEWLPTREPRARTGDPKDDPDANLRYNRVAHFGDVASVVMLETRLLARTDPAGNPGGNVFANASGTIARWVAKRERAPARWRGSDLERTFLSLRDDLDAHRASPDREMLGAEQIAWIEKTTKASAALGVKWQVVAQASPVMDMMSPDLAKGAAALDENARGDAPPPPRGHASWTAALRAWVDWNGDDDDDGGGRTPNAKRVGVGGRDVPVDAARGLLAMGEYRLNWNFDDWHGYVADRAKLLRAVVPHANAAVILGGDSHDSWAGVVSDDARDWERPQGSTAAPRRVGAVEFDGPSVTPPGMFEHAHAWCPRALIDAGHLSSNPHTLRHARTGQRGFMLVDATAEEFAVDFVLTPSVRDASYSPRCDASFVARKESAGGDGGGGGGDGLRLDARTCPDLPDALARLSDRGGNGGDDAKAAPGAWAVTSLFVVAVAFGAAGVVAGRHAPCFERSDGGGGGGGGGRVGGGGHRRSSSAVDGYVSSNGGGGGGDRKMSARERRRYSELVDADVADSQLELGEWRDERRGGGGRHEREHSH
jgi:alkaline phosphatase D